MNWKYHNISLLTDRASELPLSITRDGPWSGHRRFAYDLVRFIKPRTIVELGTHYGTSYFTFCQGVKEGNLPSRCFAIDSWYGDPHAGYYGEDVYQAVRAVNEREYVKFSKLIRSRFDKALSFFEDESIHLLHIDGYHTYKAVHHDYTSWYPKLAKNGIILFHDITVRRGDIGVFRLWKELSDYPHLAFPHSNGLGVLFTKGCPETFESILENKEAFVKSYL